MWPFRRVRDASGYVLGSSGDELDDDSGGIAGYSGGAGARNGGRVRATTIESPLRLSSVDVDERFTRKVADLMCLFPVPPTSDPVTSPNSPMNIIIGRSDGGNKRSDFRRGIHAPKAFHWRGGGGGEKHQHQKQQQQQQEFNHDNPLLHQPHGSRHVDEAQGFAKAEAPPQGVAGAAGMPLKQP